MNYFNVFFLNLFCRRKKWEKDHATLPFQLQLTTPVVVADQERPLKVTINQNPANPAHRPITEAEIQRAEVGEGVAEGRVTIQATIQIQKSLIMQIQKGQKATVNVHKNEEEKTKNKK